MTTEENKAKRDGKGGIEEGSPITVGGGGGFEGKDKTVGKNRCTFDEVRYPDPEPGGDPRKKIFKHSGWKIRTFKIYTNGTGTDHSGLLPLNGECTIEVKCKSSGDDVTIISDAGGFGIDMDTRTYKDKPHPTVHENPDGSSYINEVELKGRGFNHKWKFERDAECGVCTDYIENSPRCS